MNKHYYIFYISTSILAYSNMVIFIFVSIFLPVKLPSHKDLLTLAEYRRDASTLQKYVISCVCCIWKSLITKGISKANANRIGGVMVIMLASSAIDRGFEPRSSQTNWYLLLLR